MTISRRTLLGSSLFAGASLAGSRVLAQPAPATPSVPAPAPLGPPPRSATPGHRLVVPNGALLPWTTRGGVKIYHLRAEPIHHQIAPGLEVDVL